FGGFLLLQGDRMNDCPRHYTQKKAAYRSVTIRQLIDSRGDIILFVFVMRNTKRYRLRSF
ncbi:hypothetical protein, partial [Salmonella enterica]|uniref:hypothetical protein n=1 Tax=Salmonella enterica TaxID=28901 RepID=UPI00067D2F54